MQLNDRAVLALVRLEGNSDFTTILEALKDERKEQTNELILANDPVHIHRRQGAAALLDEFLATARDARDIARKREL